MIDYTFSYANLEYFLLIFVRASAFVTVAPLVGGQNTGVVNMAKIGFAFFTSMVLYNSVPHEAVVYSTVFGYAVLVGKEALTGALIGLAAQMCMQVTGFAGQIIDMMTGLTMMQTMDPATNQSVTITGALYNQAIMAMLIISGFYRYLLSAFKDSYILVPLTQGVFHSDRLLASMIGFMRDYIVIGFRIALPVFIVTFIMNFILGIMAKVAPQMNMFSVGMQIKIVVGVGLMFITCSMLTGAENFIFSNMRTLVEEMVYSMQP